MEKEFNFDYDYEEEQKEKKLHKYYGIICFALV